MSGDATACTDEFIEFAGRLADAAGAVVRRYFRTPIGFDTKPDASPVTIADREAEQAMRELITAAYPDHGISGEEHGYDQTGADYVWFLDPIDGTRGFLTGQPMFGVLIALTHRGVPILGVIDQPILRERWLGARGRGTTFNGDSARTRGCPDLIHAALYTYDPATFKGVERVTYDQLEAQTALHRYTADCYAYGLLASGFVDIVVESELAPHDFAALVPVIEEAGGTVTDWQGAPLTTASDGHLLAAGDAGLHAKALAVLQGNP